MISACGGSLQLAFRKISHDVFIFLEVSKRSIDDETGKASFPRYKVLHTSYVRYHTQSGQNSDSVVYKVLTYFHLVAASLDNHEATRGECQLHLI